MGIKSHHQGVFKIRQPSAEMTKQTGPTRVAGQFGWTFVVMWCCSQPGLLPDKLSHPTKPTQQPAKSNKPVVVIPAGLAAQSSVSLNSSSIRYRAPAASLLGPVPFIPSKTPPTQTTICVTGCCPLHYLFWLGLPVRSCSCYIHVNDIYAICHIWVFHSSQLCIYLLILIYVLDLLLILSPFIRLVSVYKSVSNHLLSKNTDQ